MPTLANRSCPALEYCADLKHCDNRHRDQSISLEEGDGPVAYAYAMCTIHTPRTLGDCSGITGKGFLQHSNYTVCDLEAGFSELEARLIHIMTWNLTAVAVLSRQHSMYTYIEFREIEGIRRKSSYG